MSSRFTWVVARIRILRKWVLGCDLNGEQDEERGLRNETTQGKQLARNQRQVWAWGAGSKGSALGSPRGEPEPRLLQAC